MSKQTAAILFALLFGGSITGGGTVAAISDARIDARVADAIDKGLEKKLDEKMENRLKDARESAGKAAAAADGAKAAIDTLQKIVIEQNAKTNAQVTVDAEARNRLEAMVRDHETRIRDLERELASTRRR